MAKQVHFIDFADSGVKAQLAYTACGDSPKRTPEVSDQSL